jgi:hypothetical protein
METRPTFSAFSDLISGSAVQWTAFKRYNVGTFKCFPPYQGGWGDSKFMRCR